MADRKSQVIKAGLLAKINVSQVQAVATGGIFLDRAGVRANYPFLVIAKFSARPHGSFGQPVAIEESFWDLKAFAEANADKSAQQQGEEIIDAALLAIGGTLTLSSGTCRDVRWYEDLPTLRQPIPGKQVFMTWVRLRIWVV